MSPGIIGSAKYEGIETEAEEVHSGQVRPLQKWKFCAGQSNTTLSIFFSFFFWFSLQLCYFILAVY